MHTVKRILLVRLGGIGDVIHTLPLVKYLRKIYKTSSIEYITSSNISELLINHCQYIDKVWIYDKKNKDNLNKKILENKGSVDYFFNLHNSFSFFLFNLFNIKAKKFFQYKKDRDLHAVVNFAKTYDNSVSAFELDMKTLEVEETNSILSKYNLDEHRYICLVPGVGNKRPHRAWEFENWLSLTKKFLNTEKSFKTIFLGGDEEKEVFERWLNSAREASIYKDHEFNNEAFLPGFKNRAVNLTGILTLSDAAKLISKASYLVSCDTGLLHLASALSVRVIGLYGPTSPKRSGPFTSDYHVIKAKNCECISDFADVKRCKKTKTLTGYCMNSLNVNDVLSKMVFDNASV